MGYGVGIDVGTTFSAAAVFRDGQVRAVTLGQSGDAMPTTVFLPEGGEFVVGDAARRRLTEAPSGGAREFKRRLGDTTPYVLSGAPYSADRLMGVVIRHIVKLVTEVEGEPPQHVVVTHPSNWQDFKVDLLRQAATSAVQPATVSLVEEPVAAAVQYAHAERIDVGELVGVYDLGGGTFDAAVLQRTPDGFRRLGEPAGIERLGGIDFDAALMAHVQRALGERFEALDKDDRAVRIGLEQLREECIAAKQALSVDTSATINVSLPGLHEAVRITRGEFETLIRPVLGETVESLRTAIQQAGTTPDHLAAVLLIGGSSRIPVVSEVVSDEIGRPVAVDAHPKLSVAMGAAVSSHEDLDVGSGVQPSVGPVPGDDEYDYAGDGRPGGQAPGVTAEHGGDGDKRWVLRAVGIVAVVGALAAVAWFAFASGDDPPPEETSEETTLVEIQAVTIENGRYRADYRTIDFTPEFGTAPDLRHIHFFLDTLDPADAGINGSPRNQWNVTKQPTSFLTEFTPANRGAARQLCAVVAKNNHEVADPESGNCVELPADPVTPTPTPTPSPTRTTGSPTPTDPTTTPTDTSSPTPTDDDSIVSE